MKHTSLPKHTSLLIIGAMTSRRMLVLAVGVVAVLALSTVSRADSCPAFISLNNVTPQVLCAMPPMEQSMTVGMRHISFTNQAQGVVLIYDDAAHTILSDIITFQNVNGMATVTFTSDLNGNGVAPNLPVLGTYTDDKRFIFRSLALTNGKVMHAGICNGDGTACNGGSDSLRFSVGNSSVPEPGTYFLFGTGIVGLAAGSYRKWLPGFRG